MGAKFWTKEEDRILEENYPTMGKKVAELLPGRTVTACVNRATMFGISSIHRWTEEDDAIIMEKYPKLGTRVAKYLSGRHSAGACYERAHYLGVYKNKRRKVINE